VKSGNNAPPKVAPTKQVVVDESDDDDDDAPMEEVSNKPLPKSTKQVKESDVDASKTQKKTTYDDEGEEVEGDAAEVMNAPPKKNKRKEDQQEKKKNRETAEAKNGKVLGDNNKKKKSLGKMVYSCFLGQLPFDTTTAEKLKAHLQSSGVEDVNIRMLTGKDGKFRGETSIVSLICI
jgi:hypothetical protein